jgi:uroporphyrinogen decarboxylase
MDPRERMALALSHREPDRVPVDISSRSSAIEKKAYDDLKKYLGISGETEVFIRSHAEMDEEVLQLFGIDTRYVRDVPAESWESIGEDHLFIDLWGVPWRKQQGSFYYDIARFIHSDITVEDIGSMQWPSLLTDESVGKMKVKAAWQYEQTDKSIFTDVLGSGIFETAWYMRGFEKFMMDMVLDEKFTRAYLDKILEIQMEAYGKLLDAIGMYIEGVLITDDLAMQEGLLMSPELYRENIKPYQKQLFEFIQSRGVAVIYHNCGAIFPLLDDLVEIGVKVLHPVQLSAKGMDAKKLKREFGDRIVFWGGGCNTQHTLQFGTPQEVREEVKERIDMLAPGGGLVFAPEHCIQPGTPPENIIAMFEAVKEYGRYR